ncbi:MAG: protein translocase subunit SecD [Patescibacteria group bacterium]
MSRKTVKQRVAMLAVLLVVCGSIAYPNPANWVIDKVNSIAHISIPKISMPFVLGLDLQGGTRLEYKADLSRIDVTEQSGAMNGVRDVIERRVNSIGVSEPVITTAKAGDEWRVAVELAGIRDVNEAVKLIGETPILEFKEQSDEPQRALTDEEKKKLVDENAATDKLAETTLAAALKDPEHFAALAASSTQLKDETVKEGDIGFIRTNTQYSDIFEAVKNDKAGTVHPNYIQTSQYNAVVKVEEVKDAGMEIQARHILIAFAGATNSTSTVSKEDARRSIEEIRKQVTPKNFADLAKKYSQEPGAGESGGDLDWFGTGVMVDQFEKPAFALSKGQISDVIESPFGFHIIYKEDERPLSDVRVRASFFRRTQEADILPPSDGFKNTELTGKNLKRAQIDFDQRTGQPQVSLVFDDEGAKLFAEITKRNVGKPIAIYLDGTAISVPTVNQEITGGQAIINGSFGIAEAKLLAQRMNAGALPVPITLIAQQTVGPTLGATSVASSLFAALVGFALVALFMILLYRLPGAISILALVLYAAITATVFKLIPVTLTLAGIAGFILSIGIAVDANVLVYERLKEELKEGKSIMNALEEAFRRAWPSIRDGHVTVLITCTVLYWFSSSVIRGFALTLAIGTLISLFTAVVSSRTTLRFLAGTGLAKFGWLFLKKNV